MSRRVLPIIGLVAVTALVAACDKGNRPNSLANNRKLKAYCVGGFNLGKENDTRLNKAASLPDVQFRTVVSTADVAANVDKSIKCLNKEAETITLKVDCNTLKGEAFVPGIGSINGMVANVTMNSIEITNAPNDGAKFSLKIEKVIPDVKKDKGAHALAVELDHRGLNTIRATYTEKATGREFEVDQSTVFASQEPAEIVLQKKVAERREKLNKASAKGAIAVDQKQTGLIFEGQLEDQQTILSAIQPDALSPMCQANASTAADAPASEPPAAAEPPVTAPEDQGLKLSEIDRAQSADDIQIDQKAVQEAINKVSEENSQKIQEQVNNDYANQKAKVDAEMAAQIMADIAARAERRAQEITVEDQHNADDDARTAAIRNNPFDPARLQVGDDADGTGDTEMDAVLRHNTDGKLDAAAGLDPR